MFVQPVALEPIPEYARVAPAVLTHVLKGMLGDAGTLTTALDDGFRVMERRQPCLAEFIAGELAAIEGQRISAVGYFLAVLIYRSFEEAFGDRLGSVQSGDVLQTVDRLLTDGELRSRDTGDRPSYSEDAIALGQPALISLLRSEIDRVLDEAPDTQSDRIDTLYEMLLVELLALTRVVAQSS
jgi:hypothetical protein